MDETKQLINKIGLCNSIKQMFPAEFNYLQDLFSYHPNKKADGLIDIKIIKSIYNNLQLIVVYENNFTDSISWTSCVKNKLKQKVPKCNELTKAMRVSISGQIITFKRGFNNNFTCDFVKVQEPTLNFST